MPPRWYPPLSCVNVIVSYKLLSPSRVPAQLTIYANRISLMFKTEGQELQKFDLSDFFLQVFPNLDTLLVIGTGRHSQWNVYLFFSSPRARDNCKTTMRLLGFCLLDEFRQPVLERRLAYSNSLPSMSTIIENN